MSLRSRGRRQARQYREDLRNQFDAMAPERACRECGCTDSRACAGRCWWVEPDLCSSCAGDGVADHG